MAWNAEAQSLEYSDDDILDRMTPDMPEPPSYPYGCRFDLSCDDVEEAAGEVGTPGETMRFAAMATVTSVNCSEGNSRIELQIEEFAGEDGKFFEIDQKGEETWRRFGCISLTGCELAKIDLAPDCALGDTIHLIGEIKLLGFDRHEDRGDVCSLQITKLTYEDESEESRDE